MGALIFWAEGKAKEKGHFGGMGAGGCDRTAQRCMRASKVGLGLQVAKEPGLLTVVGGLGRGPFFFTPHSFAWKRRLDVFGIPRLGAFVFLRIVFKLFLLVSLCRCIVS